MDRMSKIRVMIYNRTATILKSLREILEKDEAIKVIRLINNEDHLLPEIDRLRPDVLIQEIGISNSNSLYLLSQVRLKHDTLPIIALSQKSRKDAIMAMYAVELGASEVITRPKGQIDLTDAEHHFQKRLIPTIKTVAENFILKNAELYDVDNHQETNMLNQRTYSVKRKPEVIVIGSCIGGIRALHSLLPVLSNEFTIPIVIVQHMPGYYTEALAKRLNLKTNINVREAKNRVLLNKGEIWIAPGGYQTTIGKMGHKYELMVNKTPRVNTNRPSIDVLFKSAAEIVEDRTLGILLSGRGGDGLDGSRSIQAAGGHVFIQDEKSSLAWELPGTVQHFQLADEQWNIRDMGHQMNDLSDFDYFSYRTKSGKFEFPVTKAASGSN